MNAISANGSAATGQPERYIVISADSHASAPLPAFREYIDAKYHADFDEYLSMRRGQFGDMSKSMMELFKDALNVPAEQLKAFLSHPTNTPGGAPGLFDPAARIVDIDDQGLAGEVILPDFAPSDIPFGALDSGLGRAGGMVRNSDRYAAELVRAGCRSWNRWLAEYCSHAPDRWAGVALVPIHDIDAAVAEVIWARAAGLRGGIVLPGQVPGLPGYHDPIFDPVWAACEENEMPVNCHVGNDVPDYGGRPESFALTQTEMLFFGRRALWFFMWGGVFERHPNLQFSLIEQDCYWVPQTLRELEDILDNRFYGATMRSRLSLRPSEYWQRQCHVGATFMSRPEVERRHDIGLDTIMWGADYPHLESTWPYTKLVLRHTFHSIPQAEVSRMITENAARLYGFDLTRLRPIADRIGPYASEVGRPMSDDEVPTDYLGEGFRTPLSHQT